MEFHFTTKYDQKGLTAMARALRKTIRRKHSRRSRIFGWCIVALGILLMLWTPWTPWTLRDTVTCVVVLLVLVTLLTEDRINAYFARKNMLPGMELAKCVFTEDGYTSTTEVAATEFDYEAVQSVCETEDYFVFLLGRQYGQIYEKATLSGGTEEDFRAFITGKTGKPITYIK